MRPNKQIRRETLLNEVQNRLELQRLAKVTDARTRVVDDSLGRVVSELMQYFATIRVENAEIQPSQRDVTVPVPMLDVAAYVDGTLNDEAKCNEVTEAAVSDPGVMMEIVAGVLNRQQRPIAVSSSLRDRLLAIHSATNETPIVVVERKLTRSQRTSVPRSPLRWLVGITCAAAILVALGITIRSALKPVDHSPSIADERSTKGSMETIPENDLPPEQLPGSNIAKESSSSQQRPPEEIESPERMEMVEPLGPPIDSPDQKIVRDDPGPSKMPEVQVPPRRVRAAPEPILAKWSHIHGLLVIQEESIDQVSSSYSSPRSRSVQEGVLAPLAAETGDVIVRYQTLPLSRASAQLSGNGKLVFAADTEIEFLSDGSIQLNHGEFLLASKDVPVDFRLTLNDQVVDCQADPNASLIVRRTIDGLELDMVGASVSIDGDGFEKARVAINESDAKAKRISDAPERLPKWTTTNTDRIELGRNVLAQFAAADDLQQTMLQALASGAVRGNAANLVRQWLVTISGDDLLWMIQSEDPLLREAVFQHLRSIGPADPRNGRLWRDLQSRSANPRLFAAIHAYFVDLWAEQRPEPQRREALLVMYQSAVASDRATANYLLQSFFGPGPNFDLQLSPTAQARAVGVWRTRMSRFE